MTDDQNLVDLGSAFARIAEARAVLGASNTRSGAVTCSSCMSSEIGDQGLRVEHCRWMCETGICQKQVWLAALRILAERIVIEGG